MTTQATTAGATCTDAMHLEDGLARFVLQLQADGRSPHTIRQYQRHVRALARWTADVGHGGEIAALGHEDVARFMAAPCARQCPDGRDKRATSVNALRTSVRCFFGYLHDVGLVATNPARRLRRARSSPPPVRGMPDHDLQRSWERGESGLDTVTPAWDDRQWAESVPVD